VKNGTMSLRPVRMSGLADTLPLIAQASAPAAPQSRAEESICALHMTTFAKIGAKKKKKNKNNFNDNQQLI